MKYAAAPSMDEGEDGGRYSGYERGYGGGYGEDQGVTGTTNEGGIPMKYYVRLTLSISA